MANKKFTGILVLILLTFSLLSCQGQTDKAKSKKGEVPAIDKGPLILDTLNFDLNIPHFYSNKQIFEETEETVQTLGFTIRTDTVYEDVYAEPLKPIIIEYNQKLTTLKDTLAMFGSQPFCTLNTLTTVDNKLMSIDAQTGFITKQESNDFYTFLSKNMASLEKI